MTILPFVYPENPIPLNVAITNVRFCKKNIQDKWTDYNSNIFSSDEVSISLCGHVSGRMGGGSLNVFWYHKEKIIYRDFIDKTGEDMDFISTLHPPQGLTNGIYEITVGINGVKFNGWHTQFKVE